MVQDLVDHALDRVGTEEVPGDVEREAPPRVARRIVDDDARQVEHVSIRVGIGPGDRAGRDEQLAQRADAVLEALGSGSGDPDAVLADFERVPLRRRRALRPGCLVEHEPHLDRRPDLRARLVALPLPRRATLRVTQARGSGETLRGDGLHPIRYPGVRHHDEGGHRDGSLELADDRRERDDGDHRHLTETGRLSSGTTGPVRDGPTGRRKARNHAVPGLLRWS
ncbi:hypothetical protein GCM10025865_19990 [Paraoerskovia sediminicola]|uniref:Uncharacterized protein n=1 Tax=Paraoerskovia sediminicola TaxID=1138587 RepID=A0ABN6XDE2_9CELL|nr:hypothetical protein GCM10025865_19990 [Paraoerskovia sediminicola]